MKYGGGLHWPNVKVRFARKSSLDTDEGVGGGQTVTYVVEQPSSLEVSEDVKDGAIISWPKLNVHFGIKSPKRTEEISGEAERPETVIYVIDHVVPLPVEPSSEATSWGIHFPQIKFHLGRKKHEADDAELEGDIQYPEAPEKIEGKGHGGIDWPKFNIHFGKTAKKPEVEPEIVTYIVEEPEPEEEDTKAHGKFELPKFKLRWGGKAGKDSDVTGAAEDATVTYVVKHVDPSN
jgi:hypothetical protein